VSLRLKHGPVERTASWWRLAKLARVEILQSRCLIFMGSEGSALISVGESWDEVLSPAHTCVEVEQLRVGITNPDPG
jgi:hypothetical protein